ncbi:UbiA family prenyltransferase [Bradyrhizobium sp. CIAT3101]|uniref:UbiA family prenyltransferase n=1 Tax=Bradyrhizobium sp. CIAT3101 TaxID=439387 RepID=UPI0024B0C244|nr:UbiA family prenyltransferase [Bradyrhizobium sp. CIAT3101]WFU79126.1 UbiA family prenyltransferase [Bradyrhizobium sp. CIAT3101]
MLTTVPHPTEAVSDVLRRPLVVDLDGTLIRTDLLVETGFSELGRNPWSLLGLCTALSQGKAALKHRLAQSAALDPATLPYEQAVLARIESARDEGRPVYLASASNERLVKAVADHLGIFSGWFASNQTENLASDTKAARLVAEFGEGGYDYIGNDRADLPVWAKAARAISIRTPAAVRRALDQQGAEPEHLSSQQPTWRTWAKLLRVHQYAKNTLIFVPLLLAHRFSLASITEAVLAFMAFSLCASSVYVVNDLADLQADRRHPTKRNRPLASGAIPPSQGILAVPVLFASSMLVGALVSLEFLGVLLGYFALTTAYSFILKRKMLVDVIALAMLYVVRLVAGAAAVDVMFSEWLLAFSMFFFTSLALIKRYVELAVRTDSGLPEPENRNYKLADLDVVAGLAAAAGFNAITVFALYISSDAVHSLYRHPQFLWLICPVLLYWISRALMMAHRRHMEDDPIAFALRDKNSLVAGLVVGVLILCAM